MAGYIPDTAAEKRAKLDALGLGDASALFGDVPAAVLIHDPLPLGQGKSELELRAHIQALASENKVYRVILRGAGAYNHFIPAIVRDVASNEAFVTAYTPYQPEISQGVLQSIFEYQTMICELTGMDVSNASVYDGASAAAEAAAMCRERNRTRVLCAGTAHPDTQAVMGTYCMGANAPFEIVPEKNGHVDPEALKGMLGNDTACLYVQSPNFYGAFEDVRALFALAHEAGARCVMGAHPLSLAIAASPAELGADIAVGEGQPLGMPLSYGGPYLGYMACKTQFMRRLPGRIVGETTDDKDRRAFVLTLQAREQHIRREKAQSNVCSNEALCALTASVYMSAMGAGGLCEAASQCMSKARYLLDGLTALQGVARAGEGECFCEFVTRTPGKADAILKALDARGILGGLRLDDDNLLWCVTEVVSRAELDETIRITKEALACN